MNKRIFLIQDVARKMNCANVDHERCENGMKVNKDVDSNCLTTFDGTRGENRHRPRRTVI